MDSVKLGPPGGKWQFIWNPYYPRPSVGGIGYEFYINFEKHKRAALKTLKEHQVLLEGVSIEEVSTFFKDFFQLSIGDLGLFERVYSFKLKNHTVRELLPDGLIPELNRRFARFLEEKLTDSLFAMPISGIPCITEKLEGDLLWVPGNFNLEKIATEMGIPEDDIATGVFPPIKNYKYKTYDVGEEDSWFVVKAKHENIAEAYFRRMTGALSVILQYPQSRFITGRKTIKGRIWFTRDGSQNFDFRNCLVPAVALPIYFKKNQEKLFERLCNIEDKRAQICLEFLAESWGKSRIIAFINTSIAMDALFGENGKVRTSILSGVEKNCTNVTHAKEKYSLILDIRNDILHGNTSTLETSPHYLKFYEEFNNDPADQQILILNDCLANLVEEVNSKES